MRMGKRIEDREGKEGKKEDVHLLRNKPPGLRMNFSYPTTRKTHVLTYVATYANGKARNSVQITVSC